MEVGLESLFAGGARRLLLNGAARFQARHSMRRAHLSSALCSARGCIGGAAASILQDPKDVERHGGGRWHGVVRESTRCAVRHRCAAAVGLLNAFISDLLVDGSTKVDSTPSRTYARIHARAACAFREHAALLHAGVTGYYYSTLSLGVLL
jgi:hypothetical protein